MWSGDPKPGAKVWAGEVAVRATPSQGFDRFFLLNR